jgi:hypothetical protein
LSTEAVTSLPPQVVCIPLPSAYQVAKHPTLPVLYVGCYTPGQTNRLVTFRLAGDGSIIASSKRECEDYFSFDGKTPSFDHRILRPAVNAEKKLIYLPAYPEYPAGTTAYTNANNFEFAAVALDDEGQPAKRLKLFRTEVTATQGLINIVFDPHFARLWIAYYSSFCWLNLDADGLPTSNKVGYLQQFWYWQYVPEWRRFYFTRPDSTLTIFKFAADGINTDYMQNALEWAGSSWTGNIDVSTRLRKAYVSTSVKDREVAVYSLDKEGRLIGVPRSFALGTHVYLRCDFKAMMLYGFATDGLRTLKLGDNGFPVGKSQFYPFDWGSLYDVILDEATGKLYVACTKPLAR